MKVMLLVKYEDMDKYLKGEIIEAVRKEDKSYQFDHRDEPVEVSIDPRDIVGDEIKTVTGFRNGSFRLIRIQKEGQG